MTAIYALYVLYVCTHRKMNARWVFKDKGDETGAFIFHPHPTLDYGTIENLLRMKMDQYTLTPPYIISTKRIHMCV